MCYVLGCFAELILMFLCLWVHKHEQANINTFPKGNQFYFNARHKFYFNAREFIINMNGIYAIKCQYT